MKGFTEFKGYRSRVIYDPESKEFVARGLGYPDFEIRDAKVPTENQFKPPSQTTKEYEVQLAEFEIASQNSAMPHKSRPSAPTRLSVIPGCYQESS